MLLSIFSLLLGVGVLLVGVGFFFTLLGVRAGVEGFSDAVTGVMMSFYFLGFIVGTYVCPWIIRHAGHVRAFAAMASIASTMAVVHAIVVDPVAWSVLRAITGACLVGIYMVIESWLNALATNKTRGTLFGGYMTVTLVSQALGQYLILVGDVGTFVPFGVVSVILSVALVPIVMTKVKEPAPVPTPELHLGDLFRRVPLGPAGAVTSGLVNGTFWSLGAVYAFRQGFSEAQVAAFVSTAVLGGAVLQFPIGRLSDAYDRRRVLTGISLAGAALAGVAFALGFVSPAALIACMFFYGGAAFTVYGLAVAHLNDYLRAEDTLEATRGLLLVHGVGAAVGPALAGLLMDRLGAPTLFLYFAAVLGALAAFGVAQMRKPVPETAGHTGFMPMGEGSTVAAELDPRTDAVPEEVPPTPEAAQSTAR
ncbi:MAG TPA: MFS transporter [Pelomicrobium sp.]|nr:MFS transporter [Pelomicrobium sp.]